MDFNDLKSLIMEEHSEYKSIPFWSWNNELEEEKLVEQIEDMKRAGIGGFIMHARTGLKIEYLGEKWWSCIDACLKKARELGMEAWVYDENGWPSGFVGGKLLERQDFLAQFLEYSVNDFFDENAFVVYEKTADGYEVIKGAKDGVCEYHTVYLKSSPSNTDILNPEVVDAFIKETHEEYYKRFKDSFGRELAGFFTDEPQYYRPNTPYSRFLKQEFDKENISVEKGLIYLFNQDERGYEFRTKYFSTLNKLYVKNFYKKVYDWCDSHNCKLTGHSIEESRLAHQMSCCAGVMTSYEYEHMPAIDWLGKFIPGELIVKQIGSVASQLGKKNVLTETFACGGYDTTPRELKSIAEFQYFGGINKTCQHLYPYSLSSQGKFDHPPFFARHGNWFDEFKTFNTYFDRLGFIIGETKEIYDLAIIHPMRSAYLDFLRSDEVGSVLKLDEDLIELLTYLENNGITYHLLDETILEKYGKNIGDALEVGNCKYNTIIIPKMSSIASATLSLLKGFKGRLLNLADLKYVDGISNKISLKSNIDFDEIIENTLIKVKSTGGRYSVYARSGEIGEFVFIKNNSNTEKCSFYIENFNDYRALDLTDLSIRAIDKNVTLEGLGSLILIKDDTVCVEKKVSNVCDLTDSFKVSDIGENYLLIDQVSYSFDGENFTEKMPVSEAFEQLLRKDYKGKIFVKYEFYANDLVGAKLLIEKANYQTLRINGKEIKLNNSDFDFLFSEGDISSKLILGKNEIIYSADFYEHDGVHFALFDPMATESVKNCLYFDTSIENIYIVGDFALDENFALSKKIIPARINAIEKQGYPFFKGNIKYLGKYNYSGKGNAIIQLDGDYMVANVCANGKTVDVVMDKCADITSLLQLGENDIEIIIHTSLRNTFGPHHCECNGFVTPYSFTFRGLWADGKPEQYRDEYILVNVGLKKITIKELN